jgi:hypothetical protein
MFDSTMQRTYSVMPETFVVLSVFSGGLASLLLVAPLAIAYPAQPEWKILLGLTAAIGIPIFICYWLSCFRLIITEDAVTYSSFFDGEKSVRLSEIVDAGFVGSRRTVLQVEAPNTKLVINYRVFSGKARQDLFDVLKVVDENGYREL